jgi:hypothetical protein
MNTNQSPHTADDHSWYDRDEAVGQAVQTRPESDPTMSNQLLARGDLPTSPTWQGPARRSFPVRTLIVCFTIWLIVTEVLVFDQVKFAARAKLLDQAARAFREPQVIVPSGRPSNLSIDEKVQRL